MSDLDANIPMISAGSFQNPRRGSQRLPMVCGDMTGGDAGLWPAVCVDTAGRIYALAGHAVLSQADGNQVRVFDKDGLEITGFSFDHANDLEGQGQIATVSFPKLSASDISVTASSRAFVSASGGLGDFGPGMRLVTSGFGESRNNGDFRILTASAGSITVEGGELADEAAGASVVLAADQRRAEPLGVQAMGLTDEGGLIENPVSLLKHLLTEVGGLAADDLEPSSFSRAWARAEALGYRAAGVVQSPLSLANLASRLLGCFLGSWWRGGDGRVKAHLDLGPGSVNEGELAYSLRGEHLSQVTASAKLDEVVNQAGALYGPDFIAGDYASELDSAQCRDLASQGQYGVREQILELPWVRRSQDALTICQRLVSLLARPRRNIACQEDSLGGLALEKGDAALISVPWLADGDGLPLCNQIVRVLSIEPALDTGTIRFSLLDTGYYKTLAYPADGVYPAGGAVLAGGERDRRRY